MDDNPPESKLKQIRTYQGDVASAIEKQKESLYSIQKAEKDARESLGEGPSSPLKRPPFIFTASILLIVLGGAGGWFAYNEFLKQNTPPSPDIPENRFISTEESVNIEIPGLTRDSLIETVSQEYSESLKHIVLKMGNELATSTPFLEKLGVFAPGSLVRALMPNFMLGTAGDTPFLIFKIKSFENAYAGMLTWEKNFTEKLDEGYVFKDMVYKNKDARALYSNTEIILLYSFLERDYLIITENTDTLDMLIDRLIREKLAR
mgnify:CR=1 FL=1